MSRAFLRTCLTASGLVAVAVATAALTVACSVVTKVDFNECVSSDECRGAFGLGWVCGDAGLCQEVEVLKRCGIENFKDVNVLVDPEIREGIKQFTNWPTIPQLYVKGEFIGGCDIVREMYQSGELATLLKEKGVKAA